MYSFILRRAIYILRQYIITENIYRGVACGWPLLLISVTAQKSCECNRAKKLRKKCAKIVVHTREENRLKDILESKGLTHVL